VIRGARRKPADRAGGWVQDFPQRGKKFSMAWKITGKSFHGVENPDFSFLIAVLGIRLCTYAYKCI
jgi:hypothetical protein